MKKSYKVLLTATFVVLYFLLVTFTVIESVAYSDFLYYKHYESNSATSRTGLTDEELVYITDEIQSFLKGNRDDFDIKITRNDKDVSVFNEQEILHMNDVQVLFLKYRALRDGSIVLILMLIVTLKKMYRKDLYSAIKISLCVLIGMYALIAVGGFFFFDELFVVFHKIFFTNDLWFFDINTSILVNILPTNFFIECASRIGIYSVLVYTVLTVIFTVVAKRPQKVDSVCGSKGE